MEQRLDEEDSATDVSRDSGNVSQSESSGSVISEGLSSGNISQSHSFSAAVPQEDGDPERLLERTAKSYSSYLKANVAEEVESLEKSLEEMLTRVDEFVGMLDMIRNDTTQVVNDSLPQIHRKSEEMRKIYKKIDKLDAFVKMVGHNVTVMEEQVTQAESDLATFPSAFKKIFRTITVPAFLNKTTTPRRQQEPPPVFRTEDYFSPHSGQ
ncbi:biogenesis of lysosome-related organelles complex 1 subunit 4 [Huso huso]|uniref:Biogenesis of lysosome-related organelles complex 1 subunit 4 n=2 Tax=Acipenseridae TaxID=7900 RepID=A0A444U4D3_ACIRT|nr:biogenesis of lysosome-related organelles complex 1 subunit 4 [Acipenser ruthenus]RXM29979.1 Biogenesis of lysosome-related organelles complex 1 subunit 4 [Acipenser ruthenus]